VLPVKIIWFGRGKEKGDLNTFVREPFFQIINFDDGFRHLQNIGDMFILAYLINLMHPFLLCLEHPRGNRLPQGPNDRIVLGVGRMDICFADR
jgi:hypothetical protein